MLVLSRRESEKVLFPKLGITVEVSRVEGKSVRLGIDAPDEIRIIRGELLGTADLEVKPKPKLDTTLEIQKRLNAVNLAIHLAQNQLRQQLTGHAEEALETALECLEELESTLCQIDTVPTVKKELSTAVHEARTGYSVAPKKKALVVIDPKQRAACLTLSKRLTELQFDVICVESGRDLVDFLKSRRQPALIVTPCADVEPGSSCRSPSLRMFGVGSLQLCRQPLTIGSQSFACWLDDPLQLPHLLAAA